ncbi:hypothetical protein OBBRIDRAFT_264120 [Obba rivulosa]|uniref:Phosphoribosyltransferase domain-containing protein n=1 Tax=Obba rivulosa TaxID=1052685 RepID=A0A8E2AQA8_9APHY|nr:hypothetical protein OBBRIDRAFT_264120 [Obba rivulosa]
MSPPRAPGSSSRDRNAGSIRGGTALGTDDICIVLNVVTQISAPEGLKNFCTRYPALRVITGWIDQGLNERAYIIPGLGDFGERRQGGPLLGVDAF